MDKSQLLQEWEAHDAALIKCAQQAWAQEGAGYDLWGWEAHSLTAIVAHGHPPRAKADYQIVFLFENRNYDGRLCYQLRAIGKAPWYRSIEWRGVCLTAKSTVYKYFPAGQWMAERPELPAFQEYTGA